MVVGISKVILYKDGLQLMDNGKADNFFRNANNPSIGYLSINSVRNKIADLRIIIQSLPIEYLVLHKTQLDESFPNA